MTQTGKEIIYDDPNSIEWTNKGRARLKEVDNEFFTFFFFHFIFMLFKRRQVTKSLHLQLSNWLP